MPTARRCSGARSPVTSYRSDMQGPMEGAGRASLGRELETFPLEGRDTDTPPSAPTP